MDTRNPNAESENAEGLQFGDFGEERDLSNKFCLLRVKQEVIPLPPYHNWPQIQQQQSILQQLHKQHQTFEQQQRHIQHRPQIQQQDWIQQQFHKQQQPPIQHQTLEQQQPHIQQQQPPI
ncbi:zinc finger protein 853-like [Leptopilina heterotoma]|uniref:zinc finger protein 853-like n=1 Tax=Leptopilina heterotoma TaxID=63436 RepID=UPI001CA89365|nr:zinc finger protein 853-like [Leptopilina heterotoma]